MDVVKFTIDRAAQRLLHNLQVTLVDELYASFGKTEESWDGYTLMFRSWGPSKGRFSPLFLRFAIGKYRNCPFFVHFD